MSSAKKILLVLLFALLCVSALAAEGAAKKATTETKAGVEVPKTGATAGAAKPVDTKPVDTKPVDTKPVETKPVDTKPVDTKPPVAEPKKAEAPKAEQPKPVETKPVETKPVETKPVEPKKEAPKAETKPVEEKKAAPKAEPKKAAPKAEAQPTAAGNAFDDIQKQANVYFQKARVHAEQLAAEGSVHYAKYAQIAHDNAERLVDKYLSAQNAKTLKTNFFNIYGVIALTLIFFILAFISSKIDWVFSLNPVRAFLSAVGLGVFLTLYGFSRLVKDPAQLVIKNAPEAVENLQFLALGWFGTLVALNFVSVLRGGVRNFLQFVISGLLFVEYFELKHHIEAHTGTLPPYGLILLAFMLLTYLSFAQLEAILSADIVVDYKVKGASSAKTQKVTKEKKNK